MHINKIAKLKNNKYKVFIDGEYIITYDNVILENNLLYKKFIDEELYKKIITDTKYYDVYNSALKYSLRTRRSEKEVNTYLNKFDIDSSLKKKIIEKLKYINIVNDNEYCKAYINDKVYLGMDGINKIKNDLLNQNIPIELIDINMASIDNDILNEKLEKQIQKKIRNNTKYSNSYLKQKILNEMIGKGYNREDILLITNKYLKSDDDILDKEFNRLYNKLSLKYSKSELLLKVKQKLIQKGFITQDINRVIETKKGQ